MKNCSLYQVNTFFSYKYSEHTDSPNLLRPEKSFLHTAVDDIGKHCGTRRN